MVWDLLSGVVVKAPLGRADDSNLLPEVKSWGARGAGFAKQEVDERRSELAGRTRTARREGQWAQALISVVDIAGEGAGALVDGYLLSVVVVKAPLVEADEADLLPEVISGESKAEASTE